MERKNNKYRKVTMMEFAKAQLIRIKKSQNIADYIKEKIKLGMGNNVSVDISAYVFSGAENNNMTSIFILLKIKKINVERMVNKVVDYSTSYLWKWTHSVDDKIRNRGILSRSFSPAETLLYITKSFGTKKGFGEERIVIEKLTDIRNKAMINSASRERTRNT